jgi:hypothetical protein
VARSPGNSFGYLDLVEATTEYDTSAHLAELLRERGFTDIERYAGPGGAPCELGAGRVRLTARRGRRPATS